MNELLVSDRYREQASDIGLCPVLGHKIVIVLAKRTPRTVGGP